MKVQEIGLVSDMLYYNKINNVKIKWKCPASVYLEVIKYKNKYDF